MQAAELDMRRHGVISMMLELISKACKVRKENSYCTVHLQVSCRFSAAFLSTHGSIVAFW